MKRAIARTAALSLMTITASIGAATASHAEGVTPLNGNVWAASDTNGDGRYDRTDIDMDGDGYGDVVFYDTNFDGYLETVTQLAGGGWSMRKDTNGDGYFELLYLDSDANGAYEVGFFDADGDRANEYVLQDTDVDGEADTWHWQNVAPQPAASDPITSEVLTFQLLNQLAKSTLIIG